MGSKDHPDHPTKYQTHLGELNFTDISFPVNVTDIAKFECHNPVLSVNVFGRKAGLYPLHVSEQEGQTIDVLLIIDEEKPEKTQCDMWIKDLPHMVYKTAATKIESTHAAKPTRLLKRGLTGKPQKECQGI